MPRIGDLITGLQLMAKYEEQGEDAFCTAAEHDVIYGSGKEMSDEDKRTMEIAGWFWDEDYDYWARFT